jgi:predicted phosphoadenosine phosphosulfate sulfurtransferase
VAERDLVAFIHKPILEALKESPDGVSVVKFQGCKDNGVNLASPKKVAEAMKETNAIVYHLPSGEYRCASRAHRTALLERYTV